MAKRKKGAGRGKDSRGLSSMSVEALLSLRDNIGRLLAQRAEELRSQLQRLSGLSPKASRGRSRGGKVAPKYRDPDNPQNTWAGRGAVPRWLTQKIAEGAKRDDFLIGSPGSSIRKKRSVKKTRRRAKGRAKMSKRSAMSRRAKKTSRGAKAKTSKRGTISRRGGPRQSATVSAPNSTAASANDRSGS